MDPITEQIAHFIGHWQLAVEEGRLRQSFDEIEPVAPQPEDQSNLAGVSVRLSAPHELAPYDPGLTYRPAPPAQPNLDPAPHYDVRASVVEPEGSRLDIEYPEIPDMGGFRGSLTLLFPNPGSVVIITVQTAFLDDDDLLLNGAGASFRDPAVFHDALVGLASDAQALAGFTLPALGSEASFAELSREIALRVDAAAPASAAGAEIWIAEDAEVSGITVNGVKLEEAPVWSDHLPLHLRPAEKGAEDEDTAEGDDEDDDSAEDEDTPAPGDSGNPPGAHDFSRDFEGDGTDGADADQVDPGHTAIAGANSLINEVAIASSWLDASVFAVRGDVLQLDAISQVNVLLDHDAVMGSAVASASTSMNVAEIVTVSSEDGTEPGGDGLPASWHVTRISADIIQTNWVEQYTFATDFDRAEVVLSGNATHLGLGGNEIVNATILNEIGYQWDLIFVGGDMIDVTAITQENVLLDSDTVTASGPAGASVSTADNLLWNGVTLAKTGIDQFAALTEKFAEAAQDLAEGAETIAREVAQDALFKGTEMLRVLQIDGDFITLNSLKQTNILGDADQIHLAMESLAEALQTKLVAGSNALLNLASVEEHGIDSVIMAGGQVYSDALLYQAELIELDAAPTGVGLSSLAGEAVAFLADGMIDETSEGSIAPTSGAEGPADLDVMQTMLA